MRKKVSAIIAFILAPMLSASPVWAASKTSCPAPLVFTPKPLTFDQDQKIQAIQRRLLSETPIGREISDKLFACSPKTLSLILGAEDKTGHEIAAACKAWQKTSAASRPDPSCYFFSGDLPKPEFLEISPLIWESYFNAYEKSPLSLRPGKVFGVLKRGTFGKGIRSWTNNWDETYIDEDIFDSEFALARTVAHELAMQLSLKTDLSHDPKVSRSAEIFLKEPVVEDALSALRALQIEKRIISQGNWTDPARVRKHYSFLNDSSDAKDNASCMKALRRIVADLMPSACVLYQSRNFLPLGSGPELFPDQLSTDRMKERIDAVLLKIENAKLEGSELPLCPYLSDPELHFTPFKTSYGPRPNTSGGD